MTSKRCKGQCGQVKEATKENFHVNRCHTDGLSDICKACKSIYIKDRILTKKLFNQQFGIV